VSEDLFRDPNSPPGATDPSMAAAPSVERPPDAYVRAAIAGDRVAAQAIVEALLPRVRNLARFLLKGDGEVDDVAQLACIEILRSLHTWRGEAKLESWALRVAARVARREAKKRRLENARRGSEPPELRAVGSAPDSYIERRRLACMLDQLPDGQREALVLHHVMGMSVPEVAAELALPFETARSRLRLGMRKLRELYVQGET